MGEAKRRKKLDPNYGKSNLLKNVCRHIDSLLLQQAQTDLAQENIFSLFTNEDRGCTEQELEMIEKEIPQKYQGQDFTIWVLPKKYAQLPVEEALKYFVPISVGTSEAKKDAYSANSLSFL